MNAKKIHNFLEKLTEHEFRFLRIQLSMANDARSLIQEFNLSKIDFCYHLKIPLNDYQKYINGGFDYNVEKMALIQTVWVKLRNEQSVIEAEKNLTGIIKDK